MKTTRYQNKCFDQIDGIVVNNKELTAEVDRLHQRQEAADHEKTVQDSQNQNLVIQLSKKERERTIK